MTLITVTDQGPYRHYVLNLLWILINLLCLALTIYHLNKLYRWEIVVHVQMLDAISIDHLSKIYHCL